MSDSLSPSPVDLAELSSRHASGVDKYFRMHSGASSDLEEITETSFTLRIEVSDRVRPENREGLSFSMTKTWLRHPELAHCQWVRLRLYHSPSPQGFLMPHPDPETTAKEAVRRGIMRMFERLKEANKLPKTFLGEYIGELPLDKPGDLHRLESQSLHLK